MAKRRAHRSRIDVDSCSISPDQIAKRAYEKWLARGCADGYADQDWLEAERELRAEAGSPVVQSFFVKESEGKE